MQECCDIVDDAGGKTCRTCGDHWRDDEPVECLGPAIDRHLARMATADVAARWIVRGLIAIAVVCIAAAAIFIGRTFGAIAP